MSFSSLKVGPEGTVGGGTRAGKGTTLWSPVGSVSDETGAGDTGGVCLRSGENLFLTYPSSNTETVNVRNVQTCKKFYKSLFEPTDDVCWGTRYSGAPENYSFAISFMHLELRGFREDYLKMRGSKAEIRLQQS